MFLILKTYFHVYSEARVGTPCNDENQILEKVTLALIANLFLKLL